jgi:pimeloyl-ACP methyl ester carboxylesterase
MSLRRPSCRIRLRASTTQPHSAPIAARARGSGFVRARAQSVRVARTALAGRQARPGGRAEGSRSILWFKKDLRVTDHPGLYRLLSRERSREVEDRACEAVFVLDPDVYSSVITSRESADALAAAVESLKRELDVRYGLRLDVLCGKWGNVLPQYVGQGESNVVVFERECEGAFVAGVEDVRELLVGDGVGMKAWDCLLYEGYDVDVEAFPEWEKARVRRGDARAPLEEPEDVCNESGDNTGSTRVDKSFSLTGEAIWNAIIEANSVLAGMDCQHTEQADEATAVSLYASSSESRAQHCLESYIRAGVENEELEQAVTSFDLDDRTMSGCYPAVFNRAINVTGTLSRRQIYQSAMRYLQANGDASPFDEGPLFRGPFSWLGWIMTSSGGALVVERKCRRAKAALLGAIQQDFHLGHAYRRDGMEHEYGATTRHWRWRGVLTDYLCVEHPGDKKDRPAIVLAHGFGAFGEHWRRNVGELAEMGFDVYAPTFPGYGRSEKLSMQYGQDLWRDFLADFVSMVVERPVVICGNSIGGYISASVAADFPHLIHGLVLLNSAGQINVDFSPKQYELDLIQSPRRPPPVIVVDAISTILFSFLEGDIENQLRRLYPTRPENADEWLGKEIRRASQDPKALGVFRSVFFLPSPRPLNYLINDKYKGPVLVIQGILDPLNDATARAEQIVRACPETRLVKLDAGHCPHDECPELVNEAIAQFAQQVVPSLAIESPK